MARAKNDAVASEGESGEMESVRSVEGTVLPTFAEIYAQLSAPFDQTYQRQIPGGRSLTYITGEQATERLTEVMGPLWEWDVDNTEVLEDDTLVTGTLTLNFQTSDVGNVSVSRSGIGGARVKKIRGGDIMDLGNDVKAAETSAFKRAAAKFGVGLYLYKKGEGGEAELPSAAPQAAYGQQGNYTGNRAPVQFGSDPSSGNSTTGTITRKSANGLILDGNGVWFNTSKFKPIDLNAYPVGMKVTIEHAPGKTFIDGITQAGGEPVAAAAEEEAF